MEYEPSNFYNSGKLNTTLCYKNESCVSHLLGNNTQLAALVNCQLRVWIVILYLKFRSTPNKLRVTGVFYQYIAFKGIRVNIFLLVLPSAIL